ncbi:A disintegrin and metalloproteinase with thrombospondin motifs 9 isoform X2 [Venturia canescens]|uniref:A disintegrin and metalloproteinase with thrombospondin motifs 9 isoform X2 n=1 Tax=Venturia canescens TaxID=32260 RepID=UPI001C9BDA04|nr:A disintegrin and metalloproteinase with thrombospondin motifs 9 isoform X2 [Venturia canescens]
MPFFSSRQTSSTAALGVVLLVIVLIVFWTSMSTLNTPQKSEQFQSTNTTILGASNHFVDEDNRWINAGITLPYKPSIQSTTKEYVVSALPDIAAATNEIRDTTDDSVRTKPSTFPVEQRDVEYVTPLKISENQYEDPSDGLSMAKRHHSGHFRLPTAIVWDPHPQYEFTAFGRIFRLRLAHDSSFISPDVKITHVKINETIRDHPNHQLGCFYSGYVDGDPTSDVSVSLCDGMTGHVRTSNGSYIINPTKHWTANGEGMLEHIFYRDLKTQSNVSNLTGPGSLPDSHDCGVIVFHFLREDYDVEGAPTAMLDNSTSGATYVGDRHRDRRSSTAHVYREHTPQREISRSRFRHYSEHNGNQLYTINGKNIQRHNYWKKVDNTNVNKLTNGEDPLSNWRQRRALAHEYFVEIMVVADAKMLEYHGVEHLVPYILVLMSTVYRIYKDPSIGNPISIAVMKIAIVEQTFGMRYIHNNGISAAEMLKNFCQWQKMNNPDEPSSEHHDVALLLTRENLCQDPRQNRCETLGLAELGRMCSPGSSCAIVQDNGLATAFTIAHEIGHVLNMPHDDDLKCTKFQIDADVHNFMTRRLNNNTFRWEWSKCSRHYLTEYLENANCLLDEPTNVTSTSDPHRLPGEVYSGNRQCELAFGRGSRICSMKSADVCKKLWCTSGILGQQQRCRTQNMPWADGTPCGDEVSPNKWCHRGECASVRNLEPVNGQWGEWGPYGECTRTCGGGIQKRYRECNGPPPQNGGDYCMGERYHYRSCQTKECPLDAQDFREQQCAKFNNNNWNIPGLPTDIEWHAKYTRLVPQDRCKLFCQVESNQYYELPEKVIDGTPCGPDTFHICVHGHCKPAGCDHVLDSTAELDTCGVCGGDNSTCHKITGSHNSSVYGYSKVLKIPAGSSNIDIRQHGWNGSHNDSNYLALRVGEDGNYILNGNFMVMHQKVIIRPGLTIEYSGPETSVERLNSSRPINIDVILEVLSVGNVYPPQITYQYTVPKSILKNFTWVLKDWSKCNYACDGTKYRRSECQNIETMDFVSDDYCRPEEKPQEESQACNSYCSLKWEVTVLSECSNNCGPGNRTISSQCVQILKTANGKSPQPVANYACMHIKRPPNYEPCIGSCDSSYWSYGKWTPCSVTCGGGMQSRTAACINSFDEFVAESKCVAKEKIVQRMCGQETCPEWSFGEWSPCSASCGPGKRGRPIWCHIENQIVSPNHCSTPKPNETEACESEPCYYWDVGDWKPCNTDCGQGRQHRQVRCKNPNGEYAADVKCFSTEKPKPSKKCYGTACVMSTIIGRSAQSPDRSRRRWRVSNWSPCSRDCGEGIQQRAVTCHRINRFGWVDPSPTDGCMHANRPIGVRTCKTRECDDKYYWSTGHWRKCSHPCGKRGKQLRRLFCHDITGKRQKRSKCPRHLAPKRERRCNQRRCGPKTCLEAQKRLKLRHDGEYTLFVGGKSMRIYCHNIGTDSPREYLTLPAGDRKNYAEIYDKRLLNPNQCPYEGQRNESCECVNDGGKISGLTNFKRVRINTIKLMVVADDFTFSRTNGARRVEFGKAGDCYSRENCPQGRFSIDLTGTPLRIAPEVSWSSTKSKAVMAINKLNHQRITGRCGGYCGFCIPKTGLKLDVLPP